MSETTQRGKMRICPSCSALNSADFDRCIRCNNRLDRPPSPRVERFADRVGGDDFLATKGLVALTLGLYALQMMAMLAETGGKLDIGRMLMSGGSPATVFRFGALPPGLAAVTAQPFRLLSAVFVHFGLVHLGMNMLGLTNLGRIAEPAVGSARLVVAYVVTGIVGFATSTVWTAASGDIGATTAGASGAIFGVMGLILGFMLRRRDPRWKQFAVQAVFYSVIFGFMMNASSSGMKINNAAHLGGLVSGTLFGIAYAGQRPRRDLWVNIAAGLSIAACAASLLLAQRAAPVRARPDPLDGLLEIRPEPR
ncbi:MAG: rhomboid family intramembrane serine protease [Byssovorax sp.]